MQAITFKTAIAKFLMFLTESISIQFSPILNLCFISPLTC
jgi:hypothetical protein